MIPGRHEGHERCPHAVALVEVGSERALAGAELALEEAREERDPTGDVWLALTARR